MELKLNFAVREENIKQLDLEELASYLKDEGIEIKQSPQITHVKGDMVSTGEILLEIASVISAGVIIPSIIAWYKSKFKKKIVLTISKADVSMTVELDANIKSAEREKVEATLRNLLKE